MTKVVSHDTQEGVKVTKAVVALISELAEVRSTYNTAKARVEELREAIFAVVGKADLTLIHHNIEVARIKEQTKMVVDTGFLKKHYPEAYEASLKPQTQHNISAVTRRA
jgi:GMP synthase PP-ATPase subunit